MIRIHSSLVMASMLGLFGCATVTTGKQHLENGKAALQASTRVLQSVSQVPFPQLNVGEVQKLELGLASNVLEEGGKRRFVQGFSLPQDQKPLSVRLSSYRVGTAEDPVIFYPEVRVFDSRFNLIQTIAPEEFSYRATPNGSGLFATVFFNQDNADQALVLVTGRELEAGALKVSQDNLMSATMVGVPVGTGMVFWYIPTGTSSKPAKMRAAQMGNVEVLIEPYKPRTIQAKQ